MNLTVKQIESLNKPGKYSDGNGLYLRIQKSGSKLWQGKYRVAGKEKTASYGIWPQVGLKEARDKHANFRLQLAAGEDPLAKKQEVIKASQIAAQAVFATVAWNWYEQTSKAREWGYSRKKTITGQLRNYIVAAFGERDIREISPKEVIVFIQSIDAEGNNYTAHECLETIRRIFNYAISLELRETSPAAHLKDIIPTKPSTPMKHVTDPKRIGEILLILERAGALFPATKAVAKLSPMLFTRPTELRRMRWDELDLEAGLWSVPTERMKMRRPLLVPLPTQAIRIIEDMRIYTGQFEYVFANPRTGKAISSGAPQRLKIRQKLHAEITWHGWRHTASTLLNNKGYPKDVAPPVGA